jgi:transcriptional regulator with AAA-type ATPase domain
MNRTTLDPIHEDPQTRKLFELARRIAHTGDAVLILGPTGSGKEIIARFLHEQSERRRERFVAVNCAAIPEHLLESFFFGQVRGAFSDAVEREGFLAEADGGTLFLDEIAELPLHHQVRLLRVLDGYAYRPVGGTRDRTAHVRFIAATNRDLEAMCLDGRFRDDFYARISKLILRVPSLRERPDDVPALARRYAGEQRPDDARFAADVAAAAIRLTRHPAAWPLGVRHVQSFVARAHIYDVETAEQEMRDEWQRRTRPAAPAPQPRELSVYTPSATSDDVHTLASLIQARLARPQGKAMRATAPKNAMSLAELLLQGAPVEYAKVQEVLDQCDPRTARSNLRPLLEIGLLVEEGDGVLLSWPPVIVRLFLRQGEDDRLVPPGCIPRAHAGDLVCIQVTAQLPIEVRVLVISHHGAEIAEPVLVGHESIAIRQTKSIVFQLDEDTCLEQILVHLSWSKRGMQLVSSEVEQLVVPAPQALKRQRMHVLEQLGPGWLQEYLVHHQ